MKKRKRTLKAFVSAIEFREIDDRFVSSMKPLINHEALIKYLCTPGIPSEIENLIYRYKEIKSDEEEKLLMVPYEERILEKLVWPIRHAKTSYMVGNYIGALALCGMVSEMIAILLFDISNLKIKDKPISQKEQEAIFGREFEKLDQKRRVEVLRAYDIIDDDLKRSFDIIRIIRRRYLHLWSQDHERIQRDVVEAYHAAVVLASFVIGHSPRVGGKFFLNKEFEEYLERRGIVEDIEDNTL